MSEFELRRALRGLPAEREPAHDLWPGIAARIAAPRKRRSARRWWPVALAAAASVTLAVLVGLPVLHDRAGAPPNPSALVDAVMPANPLQRQVDAMTLEYVAALDALGGPQLPPALAPTLAELDTSATRLRAAIREDPDATFLVDQLRRTYTQRLKLTQLALTGSLS